MSRKIFAFIFVLVLFLALGGINIHRKISWKEPTDGVVWKNKAGHMTAVKVDTGSPAYLAGIKKGDILLSITIQDYTYPINNKIDLSKVHWRAFLSSQRAYYQISHEGELLVPSFFLSQKSVHPLYYFMALIGITTIIIMFMVFFKSKRPFSLANLFFCLISFSFFALFVFSPTGEMDFLDNIFYWIDEIALLVFAPLLLHSFLVFPRRKMWFKQPSVSWRILYFPAAILLFIRIFIHLSHFFPFDTYFISRFFSNLSKLDFLHYTLFTLTTLIIIIMDNQKTQNLIIKNQLKWISYGLGLGSLPFIAFYVIPFLLGGVPSRAAELSVVLLAFIPLTFAYSISSYRLFDIEVILKKAVTLISAYIVLAILYFIVSSQTQSFSENRLAVLLMGILAIILGATLFPPLLKLFQSLLDRVIYKRSYKYRRLLLSISQELTRERNLRKLAHSLLDLIGNALSVKDIALLLPSNQKKNCFIALESRGAVPSSGTELILPQGLIQQMNVNKSLSYLSSSEKRDARTDWEDMTKSGFFHFLPFHLEGKLIGALGMGKKTDKTYLNSEDWDLLETISSSVALALENAYLYDHAQKRTFELERLKDYSENIIESLTVGVAVLDQKGIVTGWNRVMENLFSLKKEEVLGKKLLNILGKKNFSSLFPPDTQLSFRLLSEISLEMPSGEKKIFDIAKTPLLDNQMNSYGTVIVFDDVTEKISLQQQLLTSEKLASIGLLSAGVAHEINTPLTGISSYVQILQKKLTNSPHNKILENIEKQTDRVARIVKNLLNFARNPESTSFQRVNLKENLEEIISLIDYKLKTMNIELELQLEPVPQIWAQGEKIQQVFINIILNAIDAMPEGGKLSLKLFQMNKTAVIQIKDTGIGIKAQHLPHIFDPFFTTKGIGKGTGLGLSISYAIVKEHEGHLTVESESGQGSTFTIYIPIDLKNKKHTESLLG
ncbi:MAG: ATP-binding protein [Acidobacteriota bacterium]